MVIIAAVDETDRARAVAREAERLSQAFDEPIRVVHVMTRADFVDLERTSVTSTGDPIEMETVREMAREIAAEVGESMEGTTKSVGLMGKPGDQVVDYAEKHDTRYIVVGPKKRSPSGKVLFGSTAQHIILHAASPVVTTITNREE